MKRQLVGLLLCVAAACGPCGFQPEPGLKVVVPAMPTTLDWNRSDPTSWVNYPVMLATQVGLTQLGPDAQVLPGVAERWEQGLDEQGHQVYTFHLRRDVQWSNGAPLVAEDFVLGWRRALLGREGGELEDFLGAPALLQALAQGAPESRVRQALEQVAIEAVDAHTLRTKLVGPRSYFLARLAYVYPFFPAPSADLKGLSEDAVQSAFDRPRDGRPLSLGPYRVERWDRAGERLRLVVNPKSSFLPALVPGERLAPVITLMKSEVGPALFERARVDFVFVDSAVALQGGLPPGLEQRALLSTYFLAFNTERPLLDQAAIRQRLAASLDREALMKGLLPQARTDCHLLPASLRPSKEENLCLTKTEGPIVLGRPLRLIYRAGESFIPEVAIAERIAQQLRRRGVEVLLEPRADFSAELARRGADGKRTFDLYLKRVGADYPHPNSFFTLFKSQGNHQTGWEHVEQGRAMARFESLLAEGASRQNEEEARALYAQAEALLVKEQAVVVPLYHPDRYFRVRPGLVGLGVDPLNFLSLKALRVEGPLAERP